MSVSSRPGYNNDQYMVMTAPNPVSASLVGNISGGNVYMPLGPVALPRPPQSNGDITPVFAPVANRLIPADLQPQIISRET